MALKAAYYTKQENYNKKNCPQIFASFSEDKDNISHPLILNRPVENDLLFALQSIDTQKLSLTNDARSGEGFCTDFQLFGSTLPEIQLLSKDLKSIVSRALSKEVCSFKYSSFFNTFQNNMQYNFFKQFIKLFITKFLRLK